jgi:hypothetical protein
VSPPDSAIAPIAARRARAEDDAVEAALEQIRTALRGIAYGTITIAIQDGVVVQIDRTEKLRLDRSRGR